MEDKEMPITHEEMIAEQNKKFKERHERLAKEYHETKERYEKLKKFNTKVEANIVKGLSIDFVDCPFELLREQQTVMGKYLHILELRAEIEDIDL